MEPKQVDTSDDIDADRRRRFEVECAKLPRIQREVFRLYRLEGLPYDEIAQRQVLTVLEVEQQMAKAVAKLMKQMDEQRLSWWERWF